MFAATAHGIALELLAQTRPKIFDALLASLPTALSSAQK
jgi:hypothetical protein